MPAQQDTPGTDFAGNFVQGTWRKHKEWHGSLSQLADERLKPAMNLYPSFTILPHSAHCHNRMGMDARAHAGLQLCRYTPCEGTGVP